MGAPVKLVDLVVIGSGSAAMTVTTRARAAGWAVAMVDRRPFGGTCALRGCDPKKVLASASAALGAVRNLSEKGLDPQGAAINWEQLMAFKRTFTDPVPEQREAALRERGVTLCHGVARFTGPNAVTAGDESIEARRAILIATGARPAPLGIPGEEHVATSDQFLALTTLPRSILFIGGGYISFEFAHIAARAGASVTIVHRGARALEAFEPDLADRLVERTRALGVDVRLESEVMGINRTGSSHGILAKRHDQISAIEADLVVHGAGRVPDVGDLDCEAAGVRCGPRGVAVTAHLQSVSNRRVYAAGDCADSGGPNLTPVAGYEGRIVAANLIDGGQLTADYSAVPSVVFTTPPLARVGITEAEAIASGRRVQVRSGETSGWQSSRRLGESASAYKVLMDEDTGRILGAHLLGPHADEIVNLFTLAMRAGMPASALKDTIWAYPTNASDVPYMV